MSTSGRAHGYMILALKDARRTLRLADHGDIDGALDGLLRARRWETLAELRQPPKKMAGTYYARIHFVNQSILRARNAVAAAVKAK